MAQKTYQIDDIGKVTFYKHRASKTIRIKLNGGTVKVTLPSWLPYKTAVEFVKKRKQWIANNQAQRLPFIDGSIIGNNYRLRLISSNSSNFSIQEEGSIITIAVPLDQTSESEAGQNRIEKYITNILKRDAENILIPMARQLANENNFNLSSLEIKKLKSRWGSCNNKKDVVLNLYLIQLPDTHIKYVIFHELAHTVHLNHSKEFWSLVEKFVPDYMTIKKEIKSHSPDIVVSRP